jgi:hypothetical protein
MPDFDAKCCPEGAIATSFGQRDKKSHKIALTIPFQLHDTQFDPSDIAGSRAADAFGKNNQETTEASRRLRCFQANCE